jgi:hypothetical protein
LLRVNLGDPNGSGGYPDWIEIHNAGKGNVDIGGMYLTDDLLNLTKWRVPDGVVIPADGDVQQGNTRMKFSLSAGGEEVGLFSTAENG